MFNKRVILIALALVCVIALTAAVIAQAQNGQRGQRGQQPGPPGMPGGPDQQGQRLGMGGPQCPVRAFAPPPAQMVQRWAQDLQLNDQQQKQATEMIGALDAKIKQIVGDAKLMPDLIAELKAEPTNPTKVNELAAKLSKQEGDILQAELQMWLRFEQMLTAEQRAKFWTLYPMRYGQGGPPGGRGMPGPPGPGQPPPPPQ